MKVLPPHPSSSPFHSGNICFHLCVDGFSRRIIYAFASTNKHGEAVQVRGVYSRGRVCFSRRLSTSPTCLFRLLIFFSRISTSHTCTHTHTYIYTHTHSLRCMHTYVLSLFFSLSATNIHTHSLSHIQAAFAWATAHFGFPKIVRSDYGGENLLAHDLQLDYWRGREGAAQHPVLTGSSVHNQESNFFSPLGVGVLFAVLVPCA